MARSARIRVSALILIMVGLMALNHGAEAQAKIDISGAWIFTFQGDAAPAQVTLKVDAGKLAGHISSPTFGDQDFTGTLEGQAIEFGINGDAGQIQYKGTVESSSAMKGTFDNPGTGANGTFTGKRKE